MKVIIKYRAALLAATLIAAMPAAAGAQSEGGKFETAVASTVRVLAIDAGGGVSSGTGWVVAAADKENRAGAAVVITARHVVAGAVRVVIIEPGQTIDDQKAATVIYATGERDVAFLEVKDLTEQPLTITRALPEQGDDVWAAGYTRASDVNETSQMAKASAIKRGGLSKKFRGPMSAAAQAPIDQVEFDAPILAGYSGGPLMNGCGRAVGLVVKDGGHVTVGDGANIALAQGVNIAVASNELIKAAKDAGVDIKTSDNACEDTVVVQPPLPCTKPGISVDAQGKICIPLPPEPTLWERVAKTMREPTTLAIISLIGLLIAGGAGWVVMRGGRKAFPESGGNLGTKPLDEAPPILIVKPSSSSGIRISGRGPGGEPIDMHFSADELAGTGVMLGVEGDNGAVVPDARANAFVSRRHARVSYDGHNYKIEDNKSSNGTFVGGAKLAPHGSRTLVNGDSIKLADITLNIAID